MSNIANFFYSLVLTFVNIKEKTPSYSVDHMDVGWTWYLEELEVENSRLKLHSRNNRTSLWPDNN
jgi:hypothetical protein